MSFFVGIWPIIKHNLIGVIGISGSLGIALLTTEIVAFLQGIPFLGPLVAKFVEPITRSIRNIALFVAGGIVIALYVYNLGVSNEAARCKLQFSAANTQAVQRGTSARVKSQRAVAGGVHDGRDTDDN
jgi:hypothetical protein